MIKRVTVENFKAFAKLGIRFRPITVLLGPNNSGKSSIIAPLRLLAQTVQSGDVGVPLLLDGPLGDFGTYRDVVFGNHRGRPMRIGIEATSEDLSGRLEAEYKYRTVRRELVLREVTLGTARRHLITMTLARDWSRHVLTRLADHPVSPSQRSRASELASLSNFIPRFSVFYPRRRGGRQDSWPLEGIVSEEEFFDIDQAIDNAGFAIGRSLVDVDYLSAMRQPPERTYHQTGAARTGIGALGENWAGQLVLDSSRPAKQRRIVPGLTSWLKQASLAADVRLNWLSDRHYEVQLKHPRSGEYQNLADVGQANSQVIPVLVGGLRLRDGATYLVEEPEIHLHPAAQAELGNYFLRLLKRGVQSVVETHSEYLVLRLQQHVAAGDLAPDDVAFYYVSSTSSGKRVREMKLDHEARFVQPIDGGFFPQRLAETKRLARLRVRDED